MRLVHTVIGSFVGIAVVLFLLPGLLYVVALSKIDRFPAPQFASGDVAFAAWQDCGERLPMRVEPLNPWTYVFSLLRGDLIYPQRKAGSRIAWAIARRYNQQHLKAGIWWHPSGGALTIWLTRHWSAEQMATTAAASGYCKAKDRQRPNLAFKPDPRVATRAA